MMPFAKDATIEVADLPAPSTLKVINPFAAGACGPEGVVGAVGLGLLPPPPPQATRRAASTTAARAIARST
ncbi:MAG TPA: hypothetical protein VNR64_11085 [Vicinamibacterales bacterium]|nr:hypothetical protein [Vicinamibacterales bacterium]